METHGSERWTRRLRRGAARWFFANFFRLLLATISLSEVVVAWWLLRACGIGADAAVWVAAPFAVYAGNYAVAWRAQRRRRTRHAVGALPKFYYAAAFTCLFCALFLACTGVAWASAKLLLGALAAEARPTTQAAALGSSLNFAFRWVGSAGMTAIVLAFGYGYTVGQWRLRLRTLPLRIRNLPPQLAGLRLVQISDIHIGQNLSRAQLEHFVARVNALEPDLICITGDIIDSPGADVAAFLPILARLRGRAGVVAILGNHDHYAGADAVEAALRGATSFTVLRDARVRLDFDGHMLHVIGLDDHGRDWARGKTRVAYLDDAMREVPPDQPVLLLCHRPDVFEQAAAAGVGLMLAGHTHGGQIGIPWFDGRVRNLAQFITRFDRGLFERDGCYLYVNCGLGVTGQRIRLSTPREITVLELQPAAVA